MNTYGYVLQNPVNYFDLLGLLTECQQNAYDKAEKCRQNIELVAGIGESLCDLKDANFYKKIIKTLIGKNKSRTPPDSNKGCSEKIEDRGIIPHKKCTDALTDDLKECEDTENQESCN